MAIADRAIFGINSIEDLYEQNIPAGQDEFHLRWNKSVPELPVLRNATMKDGVLTEPLPKSTFERIIKAVLVRCGYIGRITVHAMRRNLGKRVDGESTSELPKS
jgi:Protein of unknown function (DUF3435)